MATRKSQQQAMLHRVDFPVGCAPAGVIALPTVCQPLSWSMRAPAASLTPHPVAACMLCVGYNLCLPGDV